MYPNLSPERIQTLIDIGATKQQWEASNNNEKRNIDNALSRRQLGPFTNDMQKTGQQNVVVMGASGAGKSATANTLIGKKRFREGSSAVSVTTNFEKDSAYVDGLQLTVVDTPESWKTPVGLFFAINYLNRCQFICHLIQCHRIAITYAITYL